MNSKIPEIKLEQIRIDAMQRLSKEFLIESANVIEEIAFEELTLVIHAYVWGEKETLKCQEIRYPDGWWQAFKEKWFPAWLLSKYPIAYRIVTLNVRAIYPKCKFLPEEIVGPGRLIIERGETIKKA